MKHDTWDITEKNVGNFRRNLGKDTINIQHKPRNIKDQYSEYKGENVIYLRQIQMK